VSFSVVGKERPCLEGKKETGEHQRQGWQFEVVPSSYRAEKTENVLTTAKRKKVRMILLGRDPQKKRRKRKENFTSQERDLGEAARKDKRCLRIMGNRKRREPNEFQKTWRGGVKGND